MHDVQVDVVLMHSAQVTLQASQVLVAALAKYPEEHVAPQVLAVRSRNELDEQAVQLVAVPPLQLRQEGSQDTQLVPLL